MRIFNTESVVESLACTPSASSSSRRLPEMIMTAKVVAAVLGISEDTLHRLVAAGKLPPGEYCQQYEIAGLLVRATYKWKFSALKAWLSKEVAKRSAGLDEPTEGQIGGAA